MRTAGAAGPRFLTVDLISVTHPAGLGVAVHRLAALAGDNGTGLRLYVPTDPIMMLVELLTTLTVRVSKVMRVLRPRDDPGEVLRVSEVGPLALWQSQVHRLRRYMSSAGPAVSKTA